MIEAFFLWIYTAAGPRGRQVAQIIDEALAFPHPQSPEAFKRQLAAWKAHDTLDRLADHGSHAGHRRRRGHRHPAGPGRAVAERIPGAEFVVLPGEAHQPFQERPEEFNALVDAFWRKVDGRAEPSVTPPSENSAMAGPTTSGRSTWELWPAPSTWTCGQSGRSTASRSAIGRSK